MLEPLSSEKITDFINPVSRVLLKTLTIFDSLASTSQYLLNHLAEAAAPWAVFSETQTAGRGRLGRAWVSEPLKSLTFSLLWVLPDSSTLSGLSIAVGVIIAKALKKIVRQDIQLKWPNDLLFSQRKLGGILLEARGPRIVIGIGMNVVPFSWANTNCISLSEITPKNISRNELAGHLLNALLEALPLYEKEGVTPFLVDWQKHDCLFQKTVTMILPQQEVTGIAVGLNERGELLLKDHQSSIHAFSYGEASVQWEK